MTTTDVTGGSSAPARSAVRTPGPVDQVCGGPGHFGLNRSDGWSLSYGGGGADTCERQLDGPWWEETPAGNGVDCPLGTTGIGGG